MNFYVLSAFVLLAIVTQTYGQDEFYGKNEKACVKAGGLCIKKTECEQLSTKTGLCPKQRSKGFECCHGVPKSENRCKKFGGDCFEKNYCRNPLLKATDCGDEKECCILLK